MKSHVIVILLRLRAYIVISHLFISEDNSFVGYLLNFTPYFGSIYTTFRQFGEY